MIHSVPLSQPPGNFQPPDNLRDRFWYDEARQELCFDGFMSKATFDRLDELSRDANYQMALDELFRICVPEDDINESSKFGLMLSAMIGLLAVCGLALLLVAR